MAHTNGVPCFWGPESSLKSKKLDSCIISCMCFVFLKGEWMQVDFVIFLFNDFYRKKAGILFDRNRCFHAFNLFFSGQKLTLRLKKELLSRVRSSLDGLPVEVQRICFLQVGFFEKLHHLFEGVAEVDYNFTRLQHISKIRPIQKAGIQPPAQTLNVWSVHLQVDSLGG